MAVVESGNMVSQFVRMAHMRGAKEARREAYATRCTPAAPFSRFGQHRVPRAAGRNEEGNEADEPLSRIGLDVTEGVD